MSEDFYEEVIDDLTDNKPGDTDARKPKKAKEYCQASNGWLCTRVKGHDGLHIAADNENKIYARWSP